MTKKRKPEAPKFPQTERMPAPTYQRGAEDLQKAFDARMDTLRHEQYEREDLARKSAEASNAALQKSFEGVCAFMSLCLYCTLRTIAEHRSFIFMFWCSCPSGFMAQNNKREAAATAHLNDAHALHLADAKAASLQLAQAHANHLADAKAASLQLAQANSATMAAQQAQLSFMQQLLHTCFRMPQVSAQAQLMPLAAQKALVDASSPATSPAKKSTKKRKPKGDGTPKKGAKPTAS